MKSQQNEGICGSTERSEVLLDVLSVMLTLQLAPEAVNKWGGKAGFEVGVAYRSVAKICGYRPSGSGLSLTGWRSALGCPPADSW